MRLLIGAMAAAISLALAAVALAQSITAPTPGPAAVAPAPASSTAAAVPVPRGKRFACQTAAQGFQGQERQDQMQLCVAQAHLDCLKQAIDRKDRRAATKGFCAELRGVSARRRAITCSLWYAVSRHPPLMVGLPSRSLSRLERRFAKRWRGGA